MKNVPSRKLNSGNFNFGQDSFRVIRRLEFQGQKLLKVDNIVVNGFQNERGYFN